MGSSSAALVLGLVSLAIYSWAVDFLVNRADTRKLADFVPPKLHAYGQLKYLTFHCLTFQIINSLLHIVSYFIRPLEKVRDLFFFSFAYPIGSIVVYSFWAVWFAMGRELIYPAKLDTVYPTQLNHAIHTVIVPINLLLCLTVGHKFNRKSLYITLGYLVAYTAFLHYIKYQTGHFVYPYLATLDDTQRIIYYLGTGVFGYGVHKSGQLLNSLIHGAQPAPIPKKRKQK